MAKRVKFVRKAGGGIRDVNVAGAVSGQANRPGELARGVPLDSPFADVFERRRRGLRRRIGLAAARGGRRERCEQAGEYQDEAQAHAGAED